MPYAAKSWQNWSTPMTDKTQPSAAGDEVEGIYLPAPDESEGERLAYLAIPETAANYRQLRRGLATSIAKAMQAEYQRGRENADISETQLIDERDKAEEAADQLSTAIGQFLGVDVGEHSNVNDPWQNALEAIPHPHIPGDGK
jgi:hypothetical protein